ncbi:hypothetical protein CVT24_005411 [Panaeolus cyanescens]|uniref:F-box domain-containing protein n=1 Tax=Panaeolus cyanescens TaxID=181874 RepID=A0A409Y917_9AGAR|nr:hypothetical protein CVT24_005411 [Panaeolus cyanescens]
MLQDEKYIDNRRAPWPEDLLSVPFNFPESLHHLLTHNNPPSSQELDELKAFKQNVQSKYQETEEKIRLLQAELERLKEESQRHQKQIFACNVAQAPFRLLTSDLLYQIAAGFPQHYSREKEITPAIHIPMILSHVSSSWRSTVHQMPNLWQEILLIWTSREIIHESDDLHRRTRQAEHFIRLSGVLPLHVALYIYDSSGLAHSIVRFFRWMVAHCVENNKRLQSLQVYDRTMDVEAKESIVCLRRLIRSLDLGNTANNTLGLRSFIIRGYGYAEDLEEGIEIDITKILEQNLDVCNIWFGRSCDDDDASAKFLQLLTSNFSGTTHVNPAWTKLVKLCISSTLHHREVRNLRWLAKLCPNLEIVSLCIDMGQSSVLYDHAPAFEFDSTVVHHKLKTIGLEFSGRNCSVLAPFEGCVFPDVASLHLQISRKSVWPDLPTMSVFTGASSSIFPDLQKLTLTSSLPSFENFRPQLLPHLNHVFHAISDFTIFLDFENQYVIKFLEFMSETPARHFPNLRKLQLQVISANGNYHGYIRASKWPSLTEFGAALQKVKLARPSVIMTLDCLLDMSLYWRRYSEMLAYFRKAEKVFRKDGLGIEVRIVHTNWDLEDIAEFDPLQQCFLPLFR